MSIYEAIMEMLARSPEEDVAFWTAKQRESYDTWWKLESVATMVDEIDAVGEDAVEAAEIAALARTKQSWISGLQETHGEIRDRNNELI